MLKQFLSFARKPKVLGVTAAAVTLAVGVVSPALAVDPTFELTPPIAVTAAATQTKDAVGPWLLAGIGIAGGMVLVRTFIWRVIGKA